MNTFERHVKRGLEAVAVAALLAIEVVVPAIAQSSAGMSCYQLWYVRNQIYARNGYCFQTAQAISVFGTGCFPPYGQLRGLERAQVNQLQTWERLKGC